MISLAEIVRVTHASSTEFEFATGIATFIEEAATGTLFGVIEIIFLDAAVTLDCTFAGDAVVVWGAAAHASSVGDVEFGGNAGCTFSIWGALTAVR